MPNPSPVQPQGFIEHQFQPLSDLPDEPLATAPLSVKVGESIYDAVMELPRRDRINFLRRVITEAVQQELFDEL